MKTLKSARGRELLGDRALSGLTADEREELARLLSEEGLEQDESFDLAAAALDLAVAPAADEPLPAALAARMEPAGRRFVAESAAESRAAPAARAAASTTAAGAQVVVMPLPDATAPRRDWTRWGGWIAAAAVVALVVGKNLQTPAGQASAGAGHEVASSLAPPLRTVVGVAAADPRAAGASAELLWSDATAHGELRVKGLSPGDYEVWIEDGARGDRYRLAAGAFTVVSGSEAVVAVTPAITPRHATRLLVTSSTEGHDLQPLLVVALAP
jgi:hypothetical protein